MKQLIAILILLSLLPINLFSKTNLNVTPDNGNTEIDLSAVNPIIPIL